MNINEAHKYVQGLSRQNQVGHIPTDKLNILFAQAQMEVIDDLWGNKREFEPGRATPITGGFERNQTIADELNPLVETKVYNSPNPAFNNSESSAHFNKPLDYMYAIDLRHKIFKNPTTVETAGGGTITNTPLVLGTPSLAPSTGGSFAEQAAPPPAPTQTTLLDDGVNKWVKLDIKTQGEISYVLDSHIVYPTMDYPVGVIWKDNIEVYPSTIQKIKVVYLKKPANPVWGYTTVGTSQIYDPSTSVEFELPSSVHNEICQVVLSYIGISTRDAELYQSVNAEITKGV